MNKSTRERPVSPETDAIVGEIIAGVVRTSPARRRNRARRRLNPDELEQLVHDLAALVRRQSKQIRRQSRRIRSLEQSQPATEGLAP